MKSFLSRITYQIKQAWTSLKLKPAFVVSIVSTMGLTLGALLCVLTLAYVMLFKPLSFPDQDRLYLVESTVVDKDDKQVFTAFNYKSLIDFYLKQKSLEPKSLIQKSLVQKSLEQKSSKQTSFENSAMIAYGKNILTSQPSQPSVTTTYVTPEIFPLLNIPMAIGRAFDQSEGLNTYNPVAILSYKTWQNEYGGSKDILKQKLIIDKVSFNIIGVVAKSFTEPKTYSVKHTFTNIWFPWDYNYISVTRRESSGSMSFDTMFLGKIAENITPSQVEQTITPLVNQPWKEMVSDIDFFTPKKIKMKLTQLKEILIGDSKNIMLMLIAGVVGLLLIAATNIANLFMARAAEQQGNYNIHASLGASKNKIFKLMLTESALLMIWSIIVAFLVASVGFTLLKANLTELLPRVNELSLNSFTLVISLLLVGLFSLFFAKLSSNTLNYKTLSTNLQSGGKGVGQQVSKNKRQFLIISQISVATFLVFININLFKDAWQIINAPLGINIDNIISVEMSTAPTVTLSEDEKIQLNKEIRSALLLLPQIKAVSLSNGSAFNGGSGFREAKFEGSEKTYPGRSRIVDENYLALYQHKLLAGDYFSEADIRDNKQLVIINEVFAHKLASTGSVIGKKLDIVYGDSFTIVGVVKGFNNPGQRMSENRGYFPGFSDEARLLIQLKDHAKLTRQEFVSVLKTITSTYRVNLFESDQSQQDKMLFTHFTILITTGILALLTFSLAAIGLYGILSYSTQMRRFEIGTRLAIGAKRSDLISLILKDNSKAILLGVLTSVVVLLGVTIGFTEQLNTYLTFELLPMFLMTLALISIISFAACYLPLRQYINRPAIHSLKG
ncbi:MAG: ABC transporter permease [Alteromonadaceae bacterium]|nr:ABC transporter permease [Alteromonadaceae bacterium]